MKRTLLILLLVSVLTAPLSAQPDRWQQAAEYIMDIDFDVASHQYTGKQTLHYQNNSPDTLHRVFYHLYFNAFQPGSMMDIRSRTIPDPDPRVGNRIASLQPHEIGYHRVQSLTQDGEPADFEVVGTVLEVDLPYPILPGSKTTFEMDFTAQVPVQIRRSGRNNKEGIDYSMAQWYPKMAEYDYQGWHAHPYIGREFYGIWGDFDVTIHIDRNYIVAATGYLQQPEEIGFGYARVDEQSEQQGDKLSWHFKAPNVHDFVWAADPDYTHDKLERPDGVTLHFFYQKTETNADAWSKLPMIMDRALDYINTHFGRYPYQQYSFIQGGDGGMEYPMATLITGERPLTSLVGVSVHEILHSWYQMVLGTNESLYAWMDEGFTSIAEDETMNYLRSEGLIPGEPTDKPYLSSINSYVRFTKTGLEEPMSVHADHFVTNAAYLRAAYTKGAVFLIQLEYIMGQKNFRQAMRRYYEEWKFKHPNPNDFIRIMEKESGLELDWFREYFVNTTHTIDYAVDSVDTQADGARVYLRRRGLMPMPMDVLVTYQDGSQELFNIALRIMRGNKPAPATVENYTTLEDWPWTHPIYGFTIPGDPERVVRIEIDPTGRLADVNRENNVWHKE